MGFDISDSDSGPSEESGIPSDGNIARPAVSSDDAKIGAAFVRIETSSYLRRGRHAPMGFGYKSEDELLHFMVRSLGWQTAQMFAEKRDWNEIRTLMTEKVEAMLKSMANMVNAIHVAASIVLGGGSINEFNVEDRSVNGIDKMDSRLFQVVVALRPSYIEVCQPGATRHHSSETIIRDVEQVLKRQEKPRK